MAVDNVPANEPPVTVPVVLIAPSPTSIEVNPEVIDPTFKAPTDVNDDVVTPEPRVLLLRTEDPLI